MVATAGRGWRLAPALERLVVETDALFPGRSTASDGSIGDPAHAARVSDHNPDDGWVDAVDLTDDDSAGCDVAVLVRHLVASKDARISYLIHNGTIWRGYDKPGLPAFTPQVYTGPNAHKLHAHVSIKDDQRASTRTWWPQSQTPPSKPEPEDIMAAGPMLIHAKDQPSRFLDAPIFVALDSTSLAGFRKAELPEATVSVTVYENIRKQIIRALGAPG